MRTRIHVSLDLKGALTNWKKKDYKNVLIDDHGKPMSPDQAKEQFLTWLSEGKLKMPMGDCDNFDYVRGCQGHPIEEEK